MKSLTDSRFAESLRALSLIFARREDEGYGRLIQPDAPVLLRAMANHLTDENATDTLAKCTELLAELEDPGMRATNDSTESLEALAMALFQLSQSIQSLVDQAVCVVPCTEVRALGLARVLEEKTNLLFAKSDTIQKAVAVLN